MKLELIDDETDKSIWTFNAKDWEDADQQVDYFLAEK